jgi:hypothetical protein
MDKISAEKAMYELTLLLMYLSRFGEKSSFGEDIRSWKGYDFEIINQLCDDDYIWQGKNPSRTKSVSFSDKGVDYAKQLMTKYNISDWE